MFCWMNSILIGYSSSELELIQERSIFSIKKNSKTRISNHEHCSKREKRTTTDKTKPGDIVNKRDKEQQATHLPPFVAGDSFLC